MYLLELSACIFTNAKMYSFPLINLKVIIDSLCNVLIQSEGSYLKLSLIIKDHAKYGI